MEPDGSMVMMEGDVQKKTLKGVMKRWHLRQAKLRGQHLYFYAQEEAVDSQVDMGFCTMLVISEDKKQLTLKVGGDSTVFKVNSAEEGALWLQHLQQVTEQIFLVGYSTSVRYN